MPKALGRKERSGTVVVAYGPAAEHAAKIQTGTHVFIEGELLYGWEKQSE